MKRIISALRLCLILVGSTLALVSCGEPEDGKYVSSTTGTSFVISGDTFILSDDNVKCYAKFEVKKDQLILTYDRIEYVGDPDEADTFEQYKEQLVEYYKANVCKSYEYEKIDGGVKLDGVKFTKK